MFRDNAKANAAEKFWEERSNCYQNLEWATKSDYLLTFLKAGSFLKEDLVLDIGTGTGIIAHTIAPHTKKVIGIDICSKMLAQSKNNKVRDEAFVKNDAKLLAFAEKSFSKVTARMVFHHIINDTQEAMDECFRVLKKGGKMILSEGIPPSAQVKPFYIEMFKLKEERLTFLEEDLVRLMERSGFKIANKIIHWNRKSSIKNWLGNCGLSPEIQNKIFKMHLELNDQGKRDYNMVITDNDCFIDMKFSIIVGEKI